MTWEIALLPIVAAFSGRIVRTVASRLAQRSGLSRTEAENATATAGLSLVVGERVDHVGRRDDDARHAVA